MTDLDQKALLERLEISLRCAKELNETIDDAIQYFGLIETTLRGSNMTDLANIVRGLKNRIDTRAKRAFLFLGEEQDG